MTGPLPTKVPPSAIRNVAILAHVDAGKTTTTEQLLYVCGRVRAPGSVEGGTTATDSLPDERARGITIASAAVQLPWRGHLVHLVDTPGHSDFASDVERVLAAVDAAVLVVSAPDGVQPHTERLWSALTRLRTPTLLYVNKCDRADADLGAVLEALRALSPDAVTVQAPAGEHPAFAGVFDLLRGERWLWPGGEARSPARAPAPAHPWRPALVAAVAERDEQVFEACARGDEVSPGSLVDAVRRLAWARGAVPVLLGASGRGIGLQPLLEAVVDLLPPPAGGPGPLSAQVFHVARDPRLGKVAYTRIRSGSVRPRDVVECPDGGWQAKVTQVRRADSLRPEPLGGAGPGEIAALCGLAPVRAGDLLGEAPAGGRAAPSLGGAPFVCAVSARGPGDLVSALRELADEDPALQVTVEGGAIRIAVLGPVHQEVLASSLQRRHGLDVTFGRPAPRYAQTIGAPCAGEAEARDARDPWAVLRLGVSLRPLPRGEGCRFEGAAPGSAVPRPCLDGVAAAFAGLTGGRARPLVDVALSLTAAKGVPLRKLARQAVDGAVSAALESCPRRIVLEPVLRFTALVPAGLLGAVLADIAAMGGRSDPPLAVGGGLWTRLEGEVPAAAAGDYPARLARRARGQGTWETQLHGYREC